MPSWTEVSQKYSVPFTTPTTSGDLVNSGNVGDISRQGTYQPRNLLPGDTSQLPTTYSVPGEGTKQVPYNTIDVPAETIPGNRLGSAANGQLPGVSNAGSLPEGRFGSVPTNTTGTLDGISGYGLKGSSEIKGLPVLGGNLASGAAAESSLAQGVLGSRLGSAVEALSPALRAVSGLAKRLSPLGNLLDLADFLRGEGTADEAGQLSKAQSAEASKKQAEKNKGNRKGNKVSGIPKPDGSKPFVPTPGATYRVTYTFTQPPYGTITNSDVLIAPFSVQKETGQYGDTWFLYANGVKKYAIGSGTAGETTAAIKGQVRIDGGTDPLPVKPTPELNPDGTPKLFGVELPDTNSSPTLNPSPSNNPKAQNTPASQKSPSAPPGVQPGKNPDGTPKKDDSPNLAPLIPFLAAPLAIPALFPGASPSPTGSPSTMGAPMPGLQPASPIATQPKAPGYSEVPGIKTTPEPVKQPQPSTPNTEGDDKCCPATQADLSEIKKVLGVGEYGVSLPLLTGDNPQMIRNLPDLLMYTNRNIDATQGLFPIRVKVKQPDGSEKTITLTDNAHALEELFAMCLTMAEDADAAVNIGARVATEVIHTKTAVMQGNDLLHSIQKFFGFDTRPTVKTVKLNFSPAAAGLNNQLENDEIEGFLKPSTQTYVSTEFSDKSTALPLLQRILHNSEIAMRAVWQPIKQDKQGRDDITGTRLKAANKKPTKAEEETWKKLQETLKILGYEGVDVTGKLTPKSDK